MPKLNYPECLLEAKLKIVGQFKTSNDHHDIECMICGSVFNATPKSKMTNFKKHNMVGCPRCTMDKRFESEKSDIQNKLKELGFVFEPFRSKLDDIEVYNSKCSCRRKWKTKATYLLTERSFCKPCNDDAKVLRMKSFNATRTNLALKNIDDFVTYKKVVYNMSNNNYNNNKDKFELKRSRENHLDHITSISFCFRYNIPPEICASLDNLRVIPARENLVKNINITSKIPLCISKLLPDNINIITFKQELNDIIGVCEVDATIGDFNYCIYDSKNSIVFNLFENSKSTQQVATRSSMYKSKNNLDNRNIKSFFFMEDEWVNKRNVILSKVKHIYEKSKTIIHARKCTIQNVIPKEKKKFLDENHILGSDRANISYGAYFNDELVALMSFSLPKVFMKGKPSSKINYELSRFCIKGDYIVTGIAGRLLKKFKNENAYDQIYSFADKRLSDGDLYHRLGFSLSSRVDLDYSYLVDGVRSHRWNYRKDMIREKFPNIYDENKKEYQMMLELGYDRIWDCGKLKFITTSH